MDASEITILTVNWFSTGYLLPLFDNLTNKAACPDRLSALIIDNTNGKDDSLNQLNKSPLKKTILKHDSQNMKSSRAHATALDFAMDHIQSPYCLTVDPDVYTFKKHWDQFCLAEMEAAGAVAVGVPYQGWKVGKYYDFPSPIFCLFETEKIRNLNASWTPFGKTSFYKLWIQIVHQIARLGGLLTRRNYENHAFLKKYARFVENCFDTFSQDTGWQIAKPARESGPPSIVFQAVEDAGSAWANDPAKTA